VTDWPRLSIHEVDGDGVGWVDLSLPSDIQRVESAVELIVHHCTADGLATPRTLFRLRVALCEAMSNAMLRGNGGNPEKLVHVRAELTAHCIRIGVGDEGDGIERARLESACLPPCLDDENGRGLFLIKSLVDRVEVDDRGNTIWMTLPRY
jgi:serine/threonine-protein kinase RsbW